MHVRAEMSIPHSALWCPRGETIVLVNRSSAFDPTKTTLLFISVVSGRELVAVPPATPVLPNAALVWTPNSQLLVSITDAQAVFVDSQTCAARSQQLSLSQQLCVHRAICSSAGLVTVAQLGQHRGMLTICSLVGAPNKKCLRILQQVPTGRVIISPVMSPNGLLAAWADCGSHMRLKSPDKFLVVARPKVQICELVTTRCATLCRMPETSFNWRPLPTNEAAFVHNHNTIVGVCLSWQPCGTARCICGPWMGKACIMPVRRVCLLP